MIAGRLWTRRLAGGRPKLHALPRENGDQHVRNVDFPIDRTRLNIHRLERRIRQTLKSQNDELDIDEVEDGVLVGIAPNIRRD